MCMSHFKCTISLSFGLDLSVNMLAGMHRCVYMYKKMNVCGDCRDIPMLKGFCPKITIVDGELEAAYNWV